MCVHVGAGACVRACVRACVFVRTLSESLLKGERLRRSDFNPTSITLPFGTKCEISGRNLVAMLLSESGASMLKQRHSREE